jgi:hypothetical protein
MTIRHDEIERFRRELEAKRAELAAPATPKVLRSNVQPIPWTKCCWPMNAN